MAETIIRVPGKFKATELGTPLADTSDLYDNENNQGLNATLQEVPEKADQSDTYTKQEVNTALGGKQDTIADLSEIRSGAAAGATAFQMPSGGIPKTDLAAAVQDSLNAADNAAPQANTYTKAEVNGLVSTPHENFVTVQATSLTTSATDVLPASGQSADTIYRVGNWDGAYNSGAGQFDVTKYTEYAWNGTAYVMLAVKSQIGEVFDISAYNSTTYADLAAALGTNGANIPEPLRKGGMSVKFVQSSDNKYVEYFLTKDEWSASEGDWDKINLENEVSQLSLEVNGFTGWQDITPLFTDGYYHAWNGTHIALGASEELCSITIDNVTEGEEYRIKFPSAPAAGSFQNFFIFAKTDDTSSIDSSQVNNYVTLVDDAEHIYSFIIPPQTSKVFSAVLVSQKSSIWVKKNVDIEGLKDLIEDIKATQIDGASLVISKEVVTPSYIDNEYKTVSGYAISTVQYNGLSTIVVEDVTAEEQYEITLANYPSQSFWQNYFVFAKTANLSAISGDNVTDYVTYLSGTTFRVVIPAGTTAFYSAVSTTEKDTIAIKKIVTQKSLNWLKVTKENLDTELKEAMSSKTQYRLWSSIKKPLALSGKVVAAFGDSITYGIASPGLVTISDSYIKLFCDYAGVATLDNNAVSATTLTQRGGGNDIYDKIVAYAGSADVIIIAGGTNDWNQGRPVGTFGDTNPASSVYGALDAICSYLAANHASAKVVFITPIPYTRPASDFPNHIAPLDEYRQAIYDVATYYGYSVVSGTELGMPEELGGWNNTMVADTDGCHPTARGHALYARSLTEKLI